MPFQSGEEWQKSGGNAKGRVPGSRNKRTQEILDLIQSRGDKDPLDFLSEVISSQNHYPHELKVQASNILAPYLHSKRSVLIPPRFIETPIKVPDFQSVEEAERYLASLPAKLGRGEIDFEAAEKISLLTRNYIEARIDATKLQLQIEAQGGGHDRPITFAPVCPEVQSPDGIGLDRLPGTNIDMSTTAYGEWKANSHHAPVIDVQPQETNSAPEQTSKDPGP
jgi:hypothetical protein